MVLCHPQDAAGGGGEGLKGTKKTKCSRSTHTKLHILVSYATLTWAQNINLTAHKQNHIIVVPKGGKSLVQIYRKTDGDDGSFLTDKDCWEG